MNYGKKSVSKKRNSLISRTAMMGKRAHVSLIRVLFVILITICVVIGCTGIGAFRGIIDNAPDVNDIDISPLGYATFLYDGDGNQLRKLTAPSSNRLPVSIDQIPVELFDAFDYVALGHIHSPQKVGRETVRYCGSPLKYSFSEAGQEKSITIVELKEKGTVELRTIPLKPLLDLRKIRGTYLEVTAKTFYENSDRTDYLMVTLTDEEDVPDGMAKLRTIYPNLMRLEYDNKRTRSNAEVTAAERIEEKSELELFQEFYELQNNQSMTEQQKAFVKALLRGIKR